MSAPSSIVFVIAETAMATLACVLIAQNPFGGEKKIERRVQRLYSIKHEQFARELGVLLGPPFV